MEITSDPVLSEDPTAKLDSIGQLMAAELTRMSLKERESALHDLHGVGDLVDESPELITLSLERLEIVLQSARQHLNAAAYSMAEQASPQYVKSNKFRLMFLRSCRFDIALTAEKIIMFFEKKLELFGPTKLCKDISLADMSPEDMDCIKHGHLQLLPQRDRAGRRVVVMLLPFIKYKQRENQV